MEPDVGNAKAHEVVDLERELELAWTVEMQRLGEVYRAGLDVGTLAFLKERFRVGRTMDRELAVLAAQRHEIEVRSGEVQSKGQQG